jgi:hypothetical protein|nr:MAG TPA: holin protein [Caudoviricetes sp.]
MHFLGGPAWVDVLVTVFVTVLASNGFWAVIQKTFDRNSTEKKLLVGLAHDRIIYVGEGFIARGWITYDEYEDFMKYLYTPYAEYGGNGTAERISDEVKKLPLRTSNHRREHRVRKVNMNENS